MIYEVACYTPANTPATDPVITAITVAPGVVDSVEVVFPSGCSGLAHMQVYRALHQLWPANPGASFTGDGNPIRWQEDYPMYDQPLELLVVTWNEDDTFPHTPVLRVNLLRQSQPPNAGDTSSSLNALLSLLTGG